MPWNASIVLLRGQNNEVRVKAPAAIANELQLRVINDDDLMIEASPDFDSWVPGPDGEVTWNLTLGAGKSGRINLVVLSRDVLQPWELPCRVMSSSLADEVDKIMVGGVDVPMTGALFFRNDPQTVTVSYKPGSPLEGYSLELSGIPRTGVQPGNLVVDQTGPHSWNVKSHTNSGTFDLEFAGANIPTPFTLTDCKVMSRYLHVEADVLIDGEAANPAGVNFSRGLRKLVTLKAKPDSPIAGHPVSLNYSIIEGLGSDDVICEPGFDSEQTGHSWYVTVVNGAGHFRLSLEGQSMTQALNMPACRSRAGAKNFIVYRGDEYLGNVQRIELVRDVTYSIRLRSDISLPLASYTMMDWEIPPSDMGVELSPGAGDWQPYEGGGGNWSFKFREVGEFSVWATPSTSHSPDVFPPSYFVIVVR